MALLSTGFAVLGASFFPVIGLAFGLFFFAYATKYYGSVAIILLFAGENGLVNGNANTHDKGLTCPRLGEG